MYFDAPIFIHICLAFINVWLNVLDLAEAVFSQKH